MVRSITRRRSASSQNMYDLNLLLALLGLPIVMLLHWLLQSANPNWSAQLMTLLPILQGQPISNQKPAPSGNVKVLQPTHQAICQPGNNSLNIRPSASFSTPIAVIPCGAGVALNGAPVWKDGESWSPVVYLNTRGWSVSRLLRKI
jgi:hypothetical protein